MRKSSEMESNTTLCSEEDSGASPFVPRVVPDMVPLNACTSEAEPVGFPFESRASIQQSTGDPVTTLLEQNIIEVAALMPPEEMETPTTGRRRDRRDTTSQRPRTLEGRCKCAAACEKGSFVKELCARTQITNEKEEGKGGGETKVQNNGGGETNAQSGPQSNI